MRVRVFYGWVVIAIAFVTMGIGVNARTAFSLLYAPIPAEIFQGRQYATIFATLSVGSTVGAGLGPWVAGALYDRTGSYVLAFRIAIASSVVSAVAVWLASPGRVRTVAGRTRRLSG